ncbi:MAG: aminotransferase class I/II-fold pyridoxal phosphate-dependent enzyme [Gemmatimonadales bacterium]|jgi:LL-diaminopimelate aminotransferase
MITPSTRLERLPTYVIAELATMKRRLAADGVDVIDLSAGDADFGPPVPAVQAIQQAVEDPAMSRYPFQAGLEAFRVAASDYMKRRFGVVFDPMRELLPLLGSKEGLAHLAAAFVNPGDVCVLPDPGYPAYVGGAALADATIERVPLEADKAFLIELDDLPTERLARTALVYLNYPNNPTAAVAPREYLERTVEVCRRHDILLAYDNPYCEITFDGYRAPSIFEIEGAREVVVEFHSLSKSFAMTGWRVAWAVGRPELVGALSKMKSWVDTGVFLAVQRAAAAALDDAERLIAPVRSELEARRDAVVEALDGIGLPVEPPKATMYVWRRLPAGIEAVPFAKSVLEREGVVVLPGTAFGEGGEGYFRLALTVGSARLREAVARIGRAIETMGSVGADA